MKLNTLYRFWKELSVGICSGRQLRNGDNNVANGRKVS